MAQKMEKNKANKDVRECERIIMRGPKDERGHMYAALTSKD